MGLSKTEYNKLLIAEKSKDPIWLADYKRRKKEAYGRWKRLNKNHRLKYDNTYNILHKEQKHLWYIKNREKIISAQKIWRTTNKTWINQRTKNKLKNNLNYHIAANLRGRIRFAIKSQSCKKANHTHALVGCTIPQLKIHLERYFVDGMNWDNYGEWHIDHIIPCNSFDLTIIEEQYKCFHYTNLQPLWAIDNIKKKDKVQIDNLR